MTQFGQKWVAYISDTIDAFIAYPDYNFPLSIVTPVLDFRSVNIIGCFCGGTHDYLALFTSFQGVSVPYLPRPSRPAPPCAQIGRAHV